MAGARSERVGGVAPPVRAQVAGRAAVGVDHAGRTVGGHEQRRFAARRQVEREGAADAAREAALVADQRDALAGLRDRRGAGVPETGVGTHEMAPAIVGADDAGTRGDQQVVARERQDQRERGAGALVGWVLPGRAAVARDREARIGHRAVALRGAVHQRARPEAEHAVGEPRPRAALIARAERAVGTEGRVDGAVLRRTQARLALPALRDHAALRPRAPVGGVAQPPRAAAAGDGPQAAARIDRERVDVGVGQPPYGRQTVVADVQAPVEHDVDVRAGPRDDALRRARQLAEHPRGATVRRPCHVAVLVVEVDAIGRGGDLQGQRRARRHRQRDADPVRTAVVGAEQRQAVAGNRIDRARRRARRQSGTVAADRADDRPRRGGRHRGRECPGQRDQRQQRQQHRPHQAVPYRGRIPRWCRETPLLWP